MAQPTKQQFLKQLSRELQRPVIKRFKRRKVKAAGVDDVWAMDLLDVQKWQKQNKGYKYLLNIIDVYSRWVWSVPLPDKKKETVFEAFLWVVEDSNRRPRHIWVDQGGEFYNRLFTNWIRQHGIIRYSTYSDYKVSIVERFNRTLRTLMWHHFISHQTRSWLSELHHIIVVPSHENPRANCDYKRASSMTGASAPGMKCRPCARMSRSLDFVYIRPLPI